MESAAGVGGNEAHRLGQSPTARNATDAIANVSMRFLLSVFSSLGCIIFSAEVLSSVKYTC